ncbi:MAG: cyclic pyranopterin monophosphate synthase MoaC, partial [Pseudomonadota bacterium]
MSKLTHIDDQGRARMVDVGDKASTRRRAEARCLLRCAPDTLNAVRSGTTPKGNVITTAELAGVMAA